MLSILLTELLIRLVEIHINYLLMEIDLISILLSYFHNNFLIFAEQEKETYNAPQFIKPIKPRVTKPNKPSVFECTIIGKPTPEVLWFCGKKEIINNENTEVTFIPSTGEAKLTIFCPTLEDETVYRVCASNNIGRAECRANLVISDRVMISKPEILRPPKITKPLPALIIEEGKPLTLSAEFESKLHPEVKWLKNGIEITPSNTSSISLLENIAKLTVIDLTKKDSGKYEIRIENAEGEARSSGSITVEESPQVQIKGEDKPRAPRFKEVIEPNIIGLGDVLIMEASVESYPEASFQWFYDDVPLQISPEVRIVKKENRSVILINGTKSEHAGTYTCRAENVAGSVTYTTRVNVLDTDWNNVEELTSPKFIKQLSPIRVMDGEGVDLTCIVRGKPTPQVQWYHNDKTIKEGIEIVLLQDSEGVCSLSIPEVFPEDAGEYTCQATNILGEVTCSTSLVVEGIK